MSTSFDFDEPDHFTAGTIGEPGHRVFFLQAAQHGSVATLRLEKQQVAALAEYLAGILADLPDAEAEPTAARPDRAGHRGVGGRRAGRGLRGGDRSHPARGRGAVEVDVDDEDDDDPSPTARPDADDDDDTATARFRLSRDQVSAFIRRAAELVVSGRPICPLCGRPIDPEGHACPRLN